MKWSIGMKIGGGFVWSCDSACYWRISYRNSTAFRESSEWVAHTHKVLRSSNPYSSTSWMRDRDARLHHYRRRALLNRTRLPAPANQD